MNKLKFFITFISLLVFVITLTFAEKRVKPLPLTDLRNPDSKNYVPYPYPSNEKEIIEDMKYAIKKIYLPQLNVRSVLIGPLPDSHIILPNLLTENPIYKIGKIYKVKNLFAGHAHDYYWHIIIVNQDDSIAARINITADGLWGGTAGGFKNRKFYIPTDDEILNDLSRTLGRNITKENIDHIQAIELPPHIGTLFTPASEIKLKNGEVYYYKSYEKEFYRIIKEYPWKKDDRGIRPDFRSFIGYTERFAFDEINDKVMIFEIIKKD